MIFGGRHIRRAAASRPKNAPGASMAKFATDEVERTPAWRDLIDGDAFGNPSRVPALGTRVHTALPHIQLNANRGFRPDQGDGARVSTLFHRARYDFSMIILYDQSANRCENAARGARA
jgi:hypothetical protein